MTHPAYRFNEPVWRAAVEARASVEHAASPICAAWLAQQRPEMDPRLHETPPASLRTRLAAMGLPWPILPSSTPTLNRRIRTLLIAYWTDPSWETLGTLHRISDAYWQTYARRRHLLTRHQL